MKKINIILIIFLLAMVCGNLEAQSGNWSGNLAGGFARGDGSMEYPYTIETGGQLAYLATVVLNNPSSYANRYYALGADIDLSAHYWDSPIGSSTLSPFRGKFDGNGKKIENLKSYDKESPNAYNQDGYGLFGYTSSAEITKLRLVDGHIYSKRSLVGLLIGNAENTTVANCSATGAVICSSQGGIYKGMAGGLIGSAAGGTISNCDFSGYMRTDNENENTGGFAGYAEDVKITDCSFSGSIFGNRSTGGFIGSGVDLVISGCFSEGFISGTERVGGFLGEALRIDIANCYALCSTSGGWCVGGFIGEIGEWNNYEESFLISGCYARGSIIGTSGGTGGLIGRMSGKDGRIEGCFSETKITGLGSGVGGFIGGGENGNGISIYNCYSNSFAKGNSAVGGFIGIAGGLEIDRCYASGSVEGDGGLEMYDDGTLIEGGFGVGGFVGAAMETSISHCASSVSVKGNTYIGGFIGSQNYFGFSGTVIRKCIATGSVEGVSYLGGFCGQNDGGTITDCYSVGAVIGVEDNTGGFVGENNSGIYENCYFDKQTTGKLVGTCEGDVGGIKALATSLLTLNALPSGFSASDWKSVAGYYPQLKAFAESDNPVFKAQGALLAVPLKLANDEEIVGDVQTFFKLADKTPDENAIIWDTNVLDKISIYNNTVYAEKSNAWRTMTVYSGELERTFKFRAPNGLLSADILDVKSNHPTNGDMFTYLIECGSDDISAYVDITLPPYSSCSPGSPVTLYANIPQKVTVTSIDGQSKTYTFVAEKRLPSDIFIQRWHDVLAVNNNFATNGGYNFIAYEWYKNGNRMSDETKGYIQIPEGSAEYTAVLTTQQRTKLGVCPVRISGKSTSTMAVFPNPVQRGQVVNVETGIAADELNNVVMQLFSTTGNLVAKQTLNEAVAEIAMPDTPGQYLLQITVNGVPQTFKIAVE